MVKNAAQASHIPESEGARRPSPRRAVVLCGGGGKGAYQIGCLQAFADHGMAFSMILGSSIGAINGAFFLANGLDESMKLWMAPPKRVLKVTLTTFLVAALRFLSIGARGFSVSKRRRFSVMIGMGLTSLGGC
jgi:predicted acylesterase/phospholipase RssA